MLIYKEQLPEDTMDVRLLELPFNGGSSKKSSFKNRHAVWHSVYVVSGRCGGTMLDQREKELIFGNGDRNRA